MRLWATRPHPPQAEGSFLPFWIEQATEHLGLQVSGSSTAEGTTGGRSLYGEGKVKN